jgi:hypothetical protein
VDPEPIFDGSQALANRAHLDGDGPVVEAASRRSGQKGDDDAAGSLPCLLAASQRCH